MPKNVGNYRLIIQDITGREIVCRLKGITRRQALARYHVARRNYQAPHEYDPRPTGRYLRLTGERRELCFDWY